MRCLSRWFASVLTRSLNLTQHHPPLPPTPEKGPLPADGNLLFDANAAGEQALVCSQTNGFDFRSAYTVEMWIKPTDLDGDVSSRLLHFVDASDKVGLARGGVDRSLIDLRVAAEWTVLSGIGWWGKRGGGVAHPIHVGAVGSVGMINLGPYPDPTLCNSRIPRFG